MRKTARLSPLVSRCDFPISVNHGERCVRLETAIDSELRPLSVWMTWIRNGSRCRASSMNRMDVRWLHAS